ncbi:hypothetical protein DPMN_029365 [Dreissena polymorpha]|uniref:Uncharacterized protein n=1 Tax=Dreissena polymorpha TaxID=45954 RepID=A0A9D4RF04_DREPO|nr:hypothetical protein DPMN_029154 [Dreissena polymorpha]KAH3866305.1 hypothetical protein DPMN_029365 [Dreissena polymorpha]
MEEQSTRIRHLHYLPCQGDMSDTICATIDSKCLKCGLPNVSFFSHSDSHPLSNNLSLRSHPEISVNLCHIFTKTQIQTTRTTSTQN